MQKYDIVGKTFKNKKGIEFLVTKQEGKTNNGIACFEVVFSESGYVAHGVTSGHIRSGEVKDYFSPSVFGVGCLGYAFGYAKRKESRRLYYTWRNMIRRCYDANYSKYHWYGEQRVTVCERWHRLDHFIEDVIKLPGYDQAKFERNEIELDKDLLGCESKVYSPETCCFLSHSENNKEALYRRWHSNKNT